MNKFVILIGNVKLKYWAVISVIKYCTSVVMVSWGIIPLTWSTLNSLIVPTYDYQKHNLTFGIPYP